MSNKKKNEQLGMSYGAASSRLKKSIMFDFAQKLGLDVCHQCGEKIERVEDISVEHKEPWLDSDDPVGKFFCLGNIAFSHLSCNSGAGRRPHAGNRKTQAEYNKTWRQKHPEENKRRRRDKYLRNGT